MVRSTARGAWWRRLLVLLIVTSTAAMAWVSTRRRPAPALPARTWSEPLPVVPAANDDPTAEVEPVAEAEPEVEPAAEPEPEPAHLFETPEPVATTLPPAEGFAAGPYPGSVLPLPDGSAPSPEFTVKGKAGSMRSHGTGSPYYGRTRAEVWFRNQEDAVAAGFRPWEPKR